MRQLPDEPQLLLQEADHLPLPQRQNCRYCAAFQALKHGGRGCGAVSFAGNENGTARNGASFKTAAEHPAREFPGPWVDVIFQFASDLDQGRNPVRRSNDLRSQQILPVQRVFAADFVIPAEMVLATALGISLYSCFLLSEVAT